MTGPERQPEAGTRPSAPARAPRPGSRRSLFYVWVGATLLHGGFDAITSWIPGLAPPYLRLRDAPEEFQLLSPIGVSVAVSCVSGLIAVISVAALLQAQRRPAVLAAMITGFWLFSAILLRVVWLSTPWSATVIALVPGFVRGVVVGWYAAFVAQRVSEPTGEAA